MYLPFKKQYPNESFLFTSIPQFNNDFSDVDLESNPANFLAILSTSSTELMSAST